jgi:hypothetical protein
MTSQIVKLEVSASIPIECEFWSEDDGWKGLSRSPAVTVRGSSFEGAKKNNYKPRSKKSCVITLRKVRGELRERLSTTFLGQNHFICIFLCLDHWFQVN